MITTEQEAAIRDTLATMPKLAVGVGSKEQACSIAALNLALTGTLTDKIPDCMSRVVGRWIIGVQDRMPATIRDSESWRELLVMAAGTGREHETERVALVMAWMWDALAVVQPLANEKGFGAAWATMLRERTTESAYAGAYAAEAASAYAAEAAGAFRCAFSAAAASDAYAVEAADSVAYAAEAAGAYAAEAAAAYAAACVWTDIDPVSCLRRLVAVTDGRALAVQPTTEGL